jgi:hypothetical protein
MPALSSSPIGPVIGHLADLAEDAGGDPITESRPKPTRAIEDARSPGGDRDGGLGDHPGQGGILQPEAAPPKAGDRGGRDAHQRPPLKSGGWRQQ